MTLGTSLSLKLMLNGELEGSYTGTGDPEAGFLGATVHRTPMPLEVEALEMWYSWLDAVSPEADSSAQGGGPWTTPARYTLLWLCHAKVCGRAMPGGCGHTNLCHAGGTRGLIFLYKAKDPTLSASH